MPLVLGNTEKGHELLREIRETVENKGAVDTQLYVEDRRDIMEKLARPLPYQEEAGGLL